MIFNIITLMALTGVVTTFIMYGYTKSQLRYEFAKPRLNIAMEPLKEVKKFSIGIFAMSLIPNIACGNIFWLNPSEFISCYITISSFLSLIFCFLIYFLGYRNKWNVYLIYILLIIFVSFSLRVA